VLINPGAVPLFLFIWLWVIRRAFLKSRRAHARLPPFEATNLINFFHRAIIANLTVLVLAFTIVALLVGDIFTFTVQALFFFFIFAFTVKTDGQIRIFWVRAIGFRGRTPCGAFVLAYTVWPLATLLHLLSALTFRGVAFIDIILRKIITKLVIARGNVLKIIIGLIGPIGAILFINRFKLDEIDIEKSVIVQRGAYRKSLLPGVALQVFIGVFILQHRLPHVTVLMLE
jgi:hypothetical protein